MACVRVRMVSELAQQTDTKRLLEVLSTMAVELSSGISEHTVASLELVESGDKNTVEVLGVDLEVEQRLRLEAGLSMVFVREVGDADVSVEVTYRHGDRRDWEEWSRDFESEVAVIYGTMGPS